MAHTGRSAEHTRTTLSLAAGSAEDLPVGGPQPGERLALTDLIRTARERSGLSKRAAARRANISEGRWRQLESGYEEAHGHRTPSHPTRATLVRIAEAVSVPPADLLRAAGFAPDSATEVVDVTGLRPDDVAKVREFVRYLRGATAEQESDARGGAPGDQAQQLLAALAVVAEFERDAQALVTEAAAARRSSRELAKSAARARAMAAACAAAYAEVVRLGEAPLAAAPPQE
ncbi:helix-turn-helix domain-containing protein [Nocardia sp. NPDC003482]